MDEVDDGDLQIDESSVHRRLSTLDVEAMVQDDVDTDVNNDDVDMYDDIDAMPKEIIEIPEQSAPPIIPINPSPKTIEEDGPSSPLIDEPQDGPSSPIIDESQDGPSSPPMEDGSHDGPSSPVATPIDPSPTVEQDGPSSPLIDEPSDGPSSPVIDEPLDAPSSPVLIDEPLDAPSSPVVIDEPSDGPSSPVIDEPLDGPCSPPMGDESPNPSSPVVPSSVVITSPSPKHINDDSISSDLPKNDESMLSQDDVASENDDGSQSPEASNHSNGMIGTPISIEESQSQPSSPTPKPKKNGEKTVVPKKRATDEEIEDGEDLEDGEIMDEEEEEAQGLNIKEIPPKVIKKEHSSGKSSSREKERSPPPKKKKDNAKENEINEELDPVKRLLAEVRENDNRQKEERERRRKEKKRAHKDDKEKQKEKEPSTKKKKKRMSEEEDEGEEFLFVRGASPGVGGDTENNWDQLDDRRGKRRRESDDGASPGHRHRRGHEGSNSPTRNRIPDRPPPKRPERREPKSDVICAYFMQGKCQKSADQCNFSHDAIPPRKMELCKFWMMECCAKKEKCLYLHNDFPCKYFHTGLVCRLADKCKFSHNALSEVTKQVLLKHIETAPKEILGDFPRLNRTGALKLINKMEAKLKGLPYDEDDNNENDMMNHGGGQPHHGHTGPERHDRHGGPDRHGHQDRHHDRSRDSNRGHFGGPGHHDTGRGGRGGHDRGGDKLLGPPDHHRGNNDRRQSRWEQSQPTRGDQEKLQELMSEAGISGFYKDTLEPEPPRQVGPPLLPSVPTTQSQMFPPQLQNLQPPLMSMLPPFLPQMMSQGQGMQSVNNPALANVLAQLQIPSSSIVSPNIPPFPPPVDNSGISQNDELGQNKPSDSGSSIPDNLPKMQRELFERIQQQQKKNQNKVQTQVSSEPEEQEENWYSDDEEEDSKKKEELKAEISDQISSVLNQIRQQSQQQQTSNTKEPEGLKTFFGDTDLRSSSNTATPSTDFKDVDLRTNSGLFKKINILPATEINASLSSHDPMVYKVFVVIGAKEKPDYSSIRQTLTPQAILMDPRLGPRKRSNSIPAPESPTDQSSESLNQPMSIPDAVPLFDPRTMKSGNQSQGGRGLLDTPNPFDSNSMSGMNMHMNDFNNPFRDPRAQGGSSIPQQTQPPQNSATAAQLAQNFAAVSALMQWPNGQPPIDPSSLFMLGFPFLPQTQGTGNQPPNPGMDFNMMQNHGGMRMRPPFLPGNPPQQSSSQQQAPPASSWERFNRGQGNLSPPL